MNDNPFRRQREEIAEILSSYDNLRNGYAGSFLNEEEFESIIDYYQDVEMYNSAMEAVGIALERFPYSSSLLLSKANLQIIFKQHEPALHTLDAVEILDKNDIDLYILRADAYMALDRADDAEAILHYALENFEGEEKVDLLFELGEVFDEYDQPQLVFDCLKPVLQTEPGNEEALFKICYFADVTGRFEESINLHKEIIEAQPFNQLAWFNLGTAYQGLNLHEKAIEAYQYAVDINESFDVAHRNMGDAYMRTAKYKDAIEALQKANILTEGDKILYEAIGYCYFRLRNYAASRENYLKALELDDSDADLHYKIATTYTCEKNFEQAVANLKIAVSKKPKKAEFHYALAECCRHAGELADALDHVYAAIDLKMKYLPAWQELLTLCYIGDQWKAGLSYVEDARQLFPNKPIIDYFEAMFLYLGGKRQESLEVLEQAVQKAPRLISQFVAMEPEMIKDRDVVTLLARHMKVRRKRK